MRQIPRAPNAKRSSPRRVPPDGARADRSGGRDFINDFLFCPFQIASHSSSSGSLQGAGCVAEGSRAICAREEIRTSVYFALCFAPDAFKRGSTASGRSPASYSLGLVNVR